VECHSERGKRDCIEQDPDPSEAGDGDSGRVRNERFRLLEGRRRGDSPWDSLSDSPWVSGSDLT
jgi:hypothetical protein